MSITSSSTNRNCQKFRVVFLGDQGVGKSSIIERYSENKYVQSYHATVGIDFTVKDVEKNGQHYRLQMWDTAGQQRYRSLIPTYLKNAHCVIFIFDVTKPSTLNNIQAWHRMFLQNQEAPGFLVANKTDLGTARKVLKADAEILSKKLGLEYDEVSAKSGKRVPQLFSSVVDKIVKHKQGELKLQEIQSSRGKLGSQNKTEESFKNTNVKLQQKNQSYLKLNCCTE